MSSGAPEPHKHPPPPPAFTAADEEVIAELKKRIERDIRTAIAAEKTQVAP